MKKAELVFIPVTIIGHLVSIVEIAKLLVNRDERLSITFLIIKLSPDPKIDSYIDSVSVACKSIRIRFIDLKHEHDPTQYITSSIETQKPNVKEEVSKLVSQSELSPDSPKLAGFVLDLFCVTMIDVANDFCVPSYIFFVSGAAYLGFELYIQALHDEQNVDPTEFKDSDAELVMPCLANPLPAKVLPSSTIEKQWLPMTLGLYRRFREAKGIMVNTFEELESYAVKSFSNGNTPPVYPVGPILNLDGDHGDHDGSDTYKDIKQWLDNQPQSSVVFLCFGSRGRFGVDQVKEIACGLEQSGHRFLWSLRQLPPGGKRGGPIDYLNPQEVLPEGFLDRTVGKVIGWAPQLDILAHPSIGGFVSHCGWNSTLESIWFGVPIAAWPLYAEQQFNAFYMVVELELGVEIKMDYRMELKEYYETKNVIVTAGEIERGIRSLMAFDNQKRSNLKEISEKGRKALMDGGSSYSWLGRLIQDMVDEMA